MAHIKRNIWVIDLEYPTCNNGCGAELPERYIPGENELWASAVYWDGFVIDAFTCSKDCCEELNAKVNGPK